VYSEYLIASDHNDPASLYFRRDSKDVAFSIQTFDKMRITVSNRGYVYKTETAEYARLFKLYDAQTGKELDLKSMPDKTYTVIIKSTDGKEVWDTYQRNEVGQYSWSYISTYTDIKAHSGKFTLTIESRGVKGPFD